jgi:hypothetical protein
MSDDASFPDGVADERELLLRWLSFLRHAVLRKVDGLTEVQARWRPGSALLPLAGIVNHLTHVEWRWIDGGFLGATTTRDESEFFPPIGHSLVDIVAAYHARAASTDDTVRSLSSLAAPCAVGSGIDLRWVLVHLINETARHAGHADATRELLDGSTGE